MKRYFITVVFFLIAINSSFSQDMYQIRQAMDFFRTNKLRSGDWKNTLTESDIQGSPYLNAEFVNGTIFTTSKLQYDNIPLRYNIYSDQIEFKTPENEIQALATPEIIEAIKIGDYKMVYAPYSSFKKIRYGFFKVEEEEGKTSLYSREEIIFKKAEEPGGYKDAEPAKFINKPLSYYIRVGMEQAKKVGNKKDIVKIFPDHKNEIAAFIKKNKTKPNNPESLKKLIHYYNSL